MRRYPGSDFAYSFGPGPWTPAVRAIIIATVAVYLVTLAVPDAVIGWLGLSPRAVVEQGRLWQVATYLFVHEPRSFFHVLFNMLAVWMFGVDLERRWGSQAFAKYYFITGVGAGLTVLLVSALPFEAMASTYEGSTIGASGAVYGLLLAWALIYPHRPILFMFVFPIPARIFAIIIGAMAFLAAAGSRGSGVSHLAHLGGLLVGWWYLRGPRNLRQELNYRIARWRMERLRRRFNVHPGGRDKGDWGSKH
jgi:membrane associated rhomboid family serine protease